MEKICWQITVAAFMQPLQYNLRSPAAKINSITNATTARSNLDAAITMRSAETKLQNAKELTTRNGVGNCSSKTGSRHQSEKKDDFEALFKRIFRRRITSAKMEQICWQIIVAAFMQPLQYDLRSPAAKNKCSHNTKQPWCSHYNAICRDWVVKHNRTTRNGVGNCSSKTGSRHQSEKKTILKHFLKGFLEGKSLAPKWRKSADKSLWQPSCSHSNTIYEVQLQKSIVLRMQPQYEATLTQPLQCDPQRLNNKHNRTTRNGVGNWSSNAIRRPRMHETQVEPHLECGTDPTMSRAWSDHDLSMIRPHTRPFRTRRTAEVDHRGSGTDFGWKNIGFRISIIKT